MSYIRCFSNPEGLYIWSDVDKTVHILSKQTVERTVPTKIFDGLIKKWKKNYFQYPCKYRCATLDEIKIPKHPKIVTLILYLLGCFRRGSIPTKKSIALYFEIFEPADYQIRLSYADWRIDMWEVTWSYIAR